MNTPTNPTEVCAIEEAGLRETPWTTSVPGQIVRITDKGLLEQEEELVEEVPVALVYNGISHAVMLATPNDIADFALGFSLTEGILKSPTELYDVEVVELTNGIEARLDIATERFVTLKDRRRNLTGRTGCGLCGVESLDAAVRNPAPVDDGLRVIRRGGTPIPNLYAAGEILGSSQTMGQAACGGMMVTPAMTFGRLLGDRLIPLETRS